MDFPNPYARFGVNVNPMGYPQAPVPGAVPGTWQQQPQQPQGQQLIRVTGIEGAKAYQMGPNSVVPLFDADNDLMYVKSTDGAGFPTIRTFAFTPVEQATSPQTDYVTRAELDSALASIREMISSAEQPVSQPDPQPKQSERYRWPGAGDQSD